MSTASKIVLGLSALWIFMAPHYPLAAQELQLDETLKNQFISLPQPDQFHGHLTHLASTPHRAGTQANHKVADYIAHVMEKAGMTICEYPYDIYMPTGPGEVEVALTEPLRMPLPIQEDIILEDSFSRSSNLDIGWNAYAGSGDVTSDVVYVNYGRKEDFEQLNKMGISIKGKIVLARYGGNFRGYKAYFAEKQGAAGLIIYTDPKDAGYVKGLTFPEGRYYNESTIQRGSVLTLPYTGDPLTPFEPALPLDDPNTPERLDPQDVDLCDIPVTPIGYRTAREILERMDGEPVPTTWQGGLPFTYRITSKSPLQLRLKVNQPRSNVRIQNIVGTFRGEEFPDEWIILGCHYDAWGYGATDPNSGSAMLLTLAESIGEMVKAGFRPRRSILFAHWDAEEYGILGSAEWVEEMKEELSANAVAYINADAACAGIRFSAASSPSLKPLIKAATKEAPYMDGALSVWNHWKGENKVDPDIGNLGGGSDQFLLPEGLPFGEWYRSAYATSDPYSGYAAWMLPGLRYYIEEKDQKGLEKAIVDHEEVFERLTHALPEIRGLLSQ